ncbi:ABC transporter ATP-binding protein [Staphylococcus muscae]|uniref:ABC transporter ATP-binding protein n=1 Tax=Staphylococcus muscae TaxID=1294 RepID=A0A240C3G3_9STAP|nr:ABC transporter ATP-binding protein [Staphylococcus muscae]AVQ32798.1 ABC transporter ATP-binding protein [Staphylococcus muscae]PNZ05806.1 ABC transporter ATP-binding protein [Staphylococcus muscae]GGA81084.1 ABC transporter ATP-binding protein [Staphylococcus muscae]SNW01676.1 amino acid ABC transporter, ATP-binding protein [Staphylococcus muscae]
MIKLQNINKSFGRKRIFENFDLMIQQGDFVVIHGASGKGKSTLLNIIGLLENPDSGTVTFKDKVIQKEKDKLTFKRDDIAYVYQHYGLLENESVLKNLTLPLNVHKKDQARIEAVMTRVGLENLPLNTKVYTCSGGEQQRIAIARAILKNPSIIIADEPTGNLDDHNSETVIEMFKALNASGVTVVLATHEPMYFSIGSKEIDLDAIII